MDNLYHAFTTADGVFYDIYDKTRQSIFTEYSSFKNRLVYNYQTKELAFQEENTKHLFTSIGEMQTTLYNLIDAAIEGLCVCSIDAPEIKSNTIVQNLYNRQFSRFSILSSDDHKVLDKTLLYNQIVFDILFDKYLSESEIMTCNRYVEKMREKLEEDKYFTESLNKKISAALKTNYEKNSNPAIEDELKKLGINPEKYTEYYYPVLRNNLNRKKPEFIWNHLYINRNILTDRQYRRVLKIDKNYSYDNFITDLIAYNEYVNKSVLLHVNGHFKQYFIMSMDYYFLETYKRIDFIFKYVDTMLSVGLSEVDGNDYMLKRFTPIVLFPYMDNDKVQLGYKHKYYRPPIYIEDYLLNQIRNSGKYNQVEFATLLLKYQLVRAKAYELFNCLCRYVSDNYTEIETFISENFNMFSYHNSNKIWDTLCSFKKMDNEEKRSFKNIAKNFMLVNQAIFPKSYDKGNLNEVNDMRKSNEEN